MFGDANTHPKELDESTVLDFSTTSGHRRPTESWILLGLKDGAVGNASIVKKWGFDASKVKEALKILQMEGLIVFDLEAKGWSLSEAGLREVQQAADMVSRTWHSIWCARPEFWQQLQYAVMVHEVFKSCDLFVVPSMDDDFVAGLVAARQQGSTKEAVTSCVLSYYDANASATLVRVVDRLCANDAFASWGSTLRQALAAHCDGRFDAITAYPLAAMIEGILLPFVSQLVCRPLTGSDRIKYDEIGTILLTNLSLGETARGVEIVLGLIDYLQQHFYDSQSGDEASRDEYSPLNRHCLLHGRQKGATRHETLLCFLILDALEAILTATREA